MDLAYLQYFFNKTFPIILNIQWQVIVSFESKSSITLFLLHYILYK